MPRRGRPRTHTGPRRLDRQAPEQVFAGRAWVRDRLQPVEIGVAEDGRINRIARSVPGGERHDFGDLILLPSATDLHVHFRDPGGPEDLETFESGTTQAAIGGVGLVADMPNTVPPVTTVDRLETKMARARGRLAVDTLLYGAAVTPLSIRRLAKSVGAFKLYLSPTTSIEEPPDPADLAPLLEGVASTGLAVSIHAEAPARFRPDPSRPPATTADWDLERPPISETEAIDEILRNAPEALRLHIAHVTTAAAAERLSLARQSFEVTPHHLLLAARADRGARFKVNPPIRSETERAALWEAYRSGRVPIVASDHAPHLLEEKERRFDRAPSGMPGVETLLPLLLARVRATDLSLPILLRTAMDRPARWAGAPHGRLALGHRANFIVVDFRTRRKITARGLHAPCGWTSFEGWEGIFPHHHYRDGRPIVLDGEYVGARSGVIVRPEFAPGAP